MLDNSILFEVIQGNTKYISETQGRSRSISKNNSKQGIQSNLRNCNGINGN